MKSMKHSSILIFSVLMFFSCGNTGKILTDAESVLNQSRLTITEDEAVKGLKEALNTGITNGVSFLSKTDGFFKNQAYKILFPPEAKKMEHTLRNYGFGSQCDKVIENINRGAERAVAEAKPVFANAITQLSIKDAISLVTGGNGAATAYLKKTTSAELTTRFKPIIQQSLDKMEATKYWKDIITIYNKMPRVQKINPDLNAYVTGKALEALFSQVEIEENKIRQDPALRATEILKKVFSYADLKKKP